MKDILDRAEMGAFEDYMDVQYRQGQQAKADGKTLIDNPYYEHSEMGKAWIDGFEGKD